MKGAKENNRKVKEQPRRDYQKTTPSLTQNSTSQQIQLETLCLHLDTTVPTEGDYWGKCSSKFGYTTPHSPNLLSASFYLSFLFSLVKGDELSLLEASGTLVFIYVKKLLQFLLIYDAYICLSLSFGWPFGTFVDTVYTFCAPLC